MRETLWREVHTSFVIVLLAVGVVSGVVLGSAVDLWVFYSGWWLLVAAVVVGASFYCRNVAGLGFALTAGLIVGGLRIAGDIGDRKYMAEFIGGDVVVTGVIYEDPEVDGSASTMRINQLVFGEDDGGREVAGSLYVKFYGSKELARSHKVTVSGKLAEGFGSFAGAMYNPRLLSNLAPDPPDFALLFRDGFAELVKKFVPSPEVDLSLGYLLGQRRALPGSLLNTLKMVGLTHIVVASGYNLSVLVRLSRRSLKRVSRFAALFSGGLLIVGFMAITGFTPSMARAGVVSGLSLLTWFFGRNFHPVKLLILVASATLLLNPFYIQDLGWILSFLSFVGVMIVGPLLTKYFYGEKEPNFVAAVVVETMAAQICCLPVLLFFFGSFSVVSIFANVLILPTIPFTMLLTFVTGVTASFAPVAGVTGWLATKLLGYHIAVVEFFGELDWALVEIPVENVWVLALYFVVIGGVVYMKQVTHYRFVEFNLVE